MRAERYAPIRRHRVAAPSLSIRTAPAPGAEQLDELIYGEAFDVLETDGAFAFGQAVRDGYVGWVAAEALASDLIEPTHRVRALRTFAFAQPVIRATSFGPLSVNSLVRVEETQGAMARVAGAGWIAAAHLAPIGEAFEDPVEIAGRFLGAPYLWGGRTSVGLDCSGLVQQALYGAGLAGPRDSDEQARLGRPVAREAIARGDLVAWRGHIGLVTDEGMLLHANAHHMAVALEPLAGAIERIARNGGGDPTAFRRLDPLVAAQAA